MYRHNSCISSNTSNCFCKELRIVHDFIRVREITCWNWLRSLDTSTCGLMDLFHVALVVQLHCGSTNWSQQCIKNEINKTTAKKSVPDRLHDQISLAWCANTQCFYFHILLVFFNCICICILLFFPCYFICFAAPSSPHPAPSFSDYPSRGCHVESPKNKTLLSCTSKLLLKFFTARLHMQNVLFFCKIIVATWKRSVKPQVEVLANLLFYPRQIHLHESDTCLNRKAIYIHTCKKRPLQNTPSETVWPATRLLPRVQSNKIILQPATCNLQPATATCNLQFTPSVSKQPPWKTFFMENGNLLFNPVLELTVI